MVHGDLCSAVVGSDVDLSPGALHEGAEHSMSGALADLLRAIQQTSPTSRLSAVASIR